MGTECALRLLSCDHSLAELILCRFPRESDAQVDRAKPLQARNEVKFAHSDHGKLRRVFGEQSQTSLEEGLRKMVAWAWEVGIQKGKAFEGVEITRNLPPSWQAWSREVAKDRHCPELPCAAPLGLEMSERSGAVPLGWNQSPGFLRLCATRTKNALGAGLLSLWQGTI
jgi:hypothetical protein